MNLLWDELNHLCLSNEPKIDYKDINELINESPSKLVTYLDGLFNQLSVERMKQLAKVNEVEELSMEYFKIDNLKSVWKLLRSKLNCSFNEYVAASEYCKISDKKFKTDLSFSDAQEAFKHLMFVAKLWLNQKKDLETTSTSDDCLEIHRVVEVAATVEEAVEAPVEQNAPQQKDDSDFVSVLSVLQSSSKESVVNAGSFGHLRDYMHVERPIQLELEKMLQEVKSDGEPSLILLCGSVGDGKSHLLAYMKEKHPDLLDGVIVHNDSTESFNPDQNSLEALEQVLGPYDEIDSLKQPTIIAINLGVLHNFYRRQREAGRFTALCDFIDKSGVFEKNPDPTNEDGTFKLLNFAETQPYILTENGAESPFFLELFNKVTSPISGNPFYVAWQRDKDKGLSSAAHENYHLMQGTVVKESIVQSLIETMIKQKIFISTRAFYNFLFEIIVPVSNEIKDGDSLQMKVVDMLPNLMYGHPDRSPLLTALSEVDPLKTRLEKTDRIVSDFILSSDPSSFVHGKLGETSKIGAWKQVHLMKEYGLQTEYSRLLIRHHELLYKEDYDETYKEFVSYLHAYYKGGENEIGELFGLIEEVIYAWKGSPKDKFVFMDSPNKKFRMAIEINIDPVVDEQIFASAMDADEVNRFSPSIRMGFSQNNEEFLFELDYQLYSLLKKIGSGYRPNRQDIQDALQFSEFHDKVLQSTDKTKNVLLVHKEDGAVLEVKKPRFSKAKFEVEKVN